MEKLLSVLLYLADIMEARSPDPVLAMLKRAERGAILASIVSLLSIAMICILTSNQVILPASSIMTLIQNIRLWLSQGCAFIALSAALYGLYQVGLYIFVLKWPEHFVDLNQRNDR